MDWGGGGLVPLPDLGAAVLEELEELWYHDVEGSVQSVAVQQLRRVLADLLQCSKRALRHGHTQRGCQIKNANVQGHRGENETASENKPEASVPTAACLWIFVSHRNVQLVLLMINFKCQNTSMATRKVHV